MSFQPDMLDMLTGAYNKATDGNIGKLFSIYGGALDALKETFETIRSWRALQNARGAVLNRKGKNYGTGRAGMDDATYRLAIQSKMTSAYAGGDPDTLIRACASLLSIEDADVFLAEGGAEATLVVNESDVPNEVFDRIDAVTAMLQQAAAAGVLLTLEMQTPIPQYFYVGLVLQEVEILNLRQVN